MKLRPYQQAASRAVIESWKECNSVLVVMPTGTGKTVLFSDTTRRMFPHKVLVLAHRAELIHQAKDKIQRVTGYRVEVEMADLRADLSGGLFANPQVIVSSIQTQTAGGDGAGRMGKFDPMMFGLLIIDECHHATAKSYRRVIDYYRQNPNLKVLGVTATPDRADEEALGQVFDQVAYEYDILSAIRDGWLVPIEQQMVEIEGLDFSSVRTTAGDLNGADLSAVMEAEKPLHGIADATIRIAGNRRTLVFASSVHQAEMLSDIFNRHRPNSSGWVCGKTDKDERARILADFAAGTLQFVVNVGVLTEGFDDPGVEVIVMGRPTKSRSLYAQMCGRALRPLPGVVDDADDSPEHRRAAIATSPKKTCLIVDFVGNAGRHKLVTTADILGGNVSDEAIEDAVNIARKNGGPVRMDELLEDAEEERQRLIEAAEEARRQELARRAKIVATASFSTQSVSPFDLFHIHPATPRGWDNGREVSAKMRALLIKHYPDVNPDRLTYTQARQLSNELFRRWENKLATYKQVKVLAKYNVNAADMTSDEAAAAIDAIARNNWRKVA